MKKRLKFVWNRRGEVNPMWMALIIGIAVAVAVAVFFILRNWQ